ncbi:amidase [Ahrensia kielensis]|uniref:Amidase n=1 Tax=Ahrensia kielensis TaxID=76980 RepID=A0ABU9T3H6_9HYPH
MTSKTFRDVERELKAFVHLSPELDTTVVLGELASPVLMSEATLAVKDLFDVQGMPSSYGSPIYANNIASVTAEIVRRAEKAGVMIAGKTVTTEFATFKPGPTCNPQNFEYTPGGSSSGSAASVGAGLVSHGIGTQTAGSVIRPAAFCGVVGFLPTMGCVSRDGLKVVSPSLDRVGVFGRSVLAAKDLSVVIADLPNYVQGNAEPKRIGFFDDETWFEADNYTQNGIKEFKSKVQKAGDVVVDLGSGQKLFELINAQCVVMGYEVVRTLESELKLHGNLISDELSAYCLEASKITSTRYAAALEVGQAGRFWIESIFNGIDAIASPSAKTLPPKTLASTGDPYINRAWSLLYSPCITLPTSPLYDNLKGAVQLVGGFGQDLKLLNIAAQYEDVISRIGTAN